MTDTTQSLRVLIGDGRSDFCAAAGADLVIAKGRLAEHCRANGIEHVAFESFAGATTMLTNWMAAPKRRDQIPRLGREPIHESALS